MNSKSKEKAIQIIDDAVEKLHFSLSVDEYIVIDEHTLIVSGVADILHNFPEAFSKLHFAVLRETGITCRWVEEYECSMTT